MAKKEDTFKVKQPDGSVKIYQSEIEIYPDQAYENYCEDGGEMTYAEFCADRFIEVK